MHKIIIVDDHTLFRVGIKVLIESEGLGEVVAEAENGQVFLDLLEQMHPDIVIMDIEMPVMNGLEAIKQALVKVPDLKILVLTMLNEKANYAEIINAGAIGLILKTSGKKEFERAFDAVLNGENYFSSGLLRQIITNNPIPYDQSTELKIDFTEREAEVLTHLCKGLTVSEIADKLFLSVRTVETHRSVLLKKTNAKNTINLILHAIKNKLVEV